MTTQPTLSIPELGLGRSTHEILQHVTTGSRVDLLGAKGGSLAAIAAQLPQHTDRPLLAVAENGDRAKG